MERTSIARSHDLHLGINVTPQLSCPNGHNPILPVKPEAVERAHAQDYILGRRRTAAAAADGKIQSRFVQTGNRLLEGRKAIWPEHEGGSLAQLGRPTLGLGLVKGRVPADDLIHGKHGL